MYTYVLDTQIGLILYKWVQSSTTLNLDNVLLQRTTRINAVAKRKMRLQKFIGSEGSIIECFEIHPLIGLEVDLVFMMPSNEDVPTLVNTPVLSLNARITSQLSISSGLVR